MTTGFWVIIGILAFYAVFRIWLNSAKPEMTEYKYREELNENRIKELERQKELETANPHHINEQREKKGP